MEFINDKRFINQYSVTKTLRFALKPIGKTEKCIEQLLAPDEERARQYKQAKKIIDEYHKAYIRKRLSEFSFARSDLEEFRDVYNESKRISEELKKDKNDEQLRKKLRDLRQDMRDLQKRMRKKIADQFKHAPMFGKDFIKTILPEWLKNSPELLRNINNPEKTIRGFNCWTSYFTGFNESRKNIYTSEEITASIGYRIVHDNLPRFLENMERYNNAKACGVSFGEVKKYCAENLDSIFTLEYFNQCLTQEGIDRYNWIRGGLSRVDNRKNKGLNGIINEYAQQIESRKAETAHTDNEENQQLEDRKKKVQACKLEELWKQILSDRSIIYFRLEHIENDAELCQKIKHAFSVEDNDLIAKEEYGDKNGNIIERDFNITKALKKVMGQIEEANSEQIYIKNGAAISTISNALFGFPELIKQSLERYASDTKFPVGRKKNKTLLAERKKWVQDTPYFSFSEIHSALEGYIKQFTGFENNTRDGRDGVQEEVAMEILQKTGGTPLFSYFKKLQIRINNEEKRELQQRDLLASIGTTYRDVKDVLEQYSKIKKEHLKHEKDKVKKIKDYLDAVQNLLYFLKPLYVKQEKRDKGKAVHMFIRDTSFYAEFESMYKILEHIVFLYNQTRNYLTRKSYSVEKYKLNFENVNLAAGWDRNKEKDSRCVILRKDNVYYLGIMNGKYNTLFEECNKQFEECNKQFEECNKQFEENTVGQQTSNGDKVLQESGTYQKMIYKQISNAGRDIQNLMVIDGKTCRKTGRIHTSGRYAGQNPELEEYKNKYLPKEINEIRKRKSYSKTNNNFNQKDLIQFINYYKERALEYWKFTFRFKPAEQYKDFSEFTDHLGLQGYSITFKNISRTCIDVDKCVEEGQLYLFQVYSKDFSPKTRGAPNLHTLYWKAIFDERNLDNVIYKLNGQAELFYRRASIQYSEEILTKGHHADNLNKKQNYPIIRDRRYTQPRYLFYVPITANFKAKGVGRFNDTVHEFLRNNPDVNILGIDRGIRHLACYTLINQKGEIIQDVEKNYQQGSLNNPLGKKDYYALLNERADKRNRARERWETIESINDLKEGYLTQVVHKISKLMVEHNAIVVFEDLHFGFKRGGLKIGKKWHQKLEKMLIDKLNYLVFKDREVSKAGGLFAALQLTAPFISFQKMGKQTGFIFYVSAYHTSKVCPVTGFVNLLYPRYETLTRAQEFFEKFDRISFNVQKEYFEFAFDYFNFHTKAVGSRKQWVLCTGGTRVEHFRNKERNNQWDTREVVLTRELQELFTTRTIDYGDGSCIKNSIIQQNESMFFVRLIRLLRLTLQMRNSWSGSREDWVISPVADAKGNFFDSRAAGNNGALWKGMPQHADANGAYHIALKGLLLKQRIDKSAINGKKPGFAISNKDWHAFIQGRNS